MPLIHKRGNLFDDAEATHFLHACNCQHAWGAGIAKQFKARFPEDYRNEIACEREPGEFGQQEHVICLYTSNGYGRYKDPPEVILRNTCRALLCLGYWWDEELDDATIRIASPKINAGLFDVPWERTEELIKAFVTLTGVTWHVWELED